MARDMRRQLVSGQSSTSANAVLSFDLPRDNVYKEIVLSLEVALTSAAASTATNIWDGSPWTNVKRIEVIADGKDTIKSYDGRTLADLNHYDFGMYPLTEISDLAASQVSGTNANPLWHALVISFGAVGMENPAVTFLDARKLSSLELRVTLGNNILDIYQGTTGTVTIDRFNLTPWGHEILDLDKDSTFSVNQETMTQTTAPATAATDRQFRLNVGNSYRRILVSTVDQNSRGAVDGMTRLILQENGIFNRRTLDAGVVKYLEMLRKAKVGGMSLGENPAAFRPQAAAAPGSTAGKETPGRFGTYLLDIAEDGRYNSLLDTFKYSDLSLLLSWDVLAATDIIRILSNIVVPNIR